MGRDGFVEGISVAEGRGVAVRRGGGDEVRDGEEQEKSRVESRVRSKKEKVRCAAEVRLCSDMGAILTEMSGLRI